MFQTNTIALGDGIHRLTILHDMRTMLIFLGGIAPLLLQPDELTFLQPGFAVVLIILR